MVQSYIPLKPAEINADGLSCSIATHVGPWNETELLLLLRGFTRLAQSKNLDTDLLPITITISSREDAEV